MPISVTHDFVPVSGGIRLRIHKYLFGRGDSQRKYPIILVHGIHNSSDLFDIPGIEELSLARILCRSGHDVYAYDQRGAGESLIENWAVGLEEDSFVDLPAVIEYVLRDSRADKVVLGGYSLGGLIIYLYVSGLAKSATLRGGLKNSQIHRVFTIASPGAFHARAGKWKNLFVRGKAMLEGAGVSVEREEFLKGQFFIRFPFLSRLVNVRMIKNTLHAAGRWKFAAFIVKSLPFPNFLFKPSDFDAETFRRMAASKALDRSPTQVFWEIFDSAESGGKIEFVHQGKAVTLPDDFSHWSGIPLLLFSSGKDELVLAEEVREVEKRVKFSRLVIIENEIQLSCGHAGYFFKKKVAPFVHEMILKFIGGDQPPACG